MNSKSLISSDPSILLWLAGALVALLGTRAFLGYLRRVRHQGPRGAWSDLLLAAFAAQACVWSAAIVGVAGQGVAYPVGYSALILFGTLFGSVLLAAGVLSWVGAREGWLSLVGTALLQAVLMVATQFGVVRAIGAEPGLLWRVPLLGFAVAVLFVGLVLAMQLVLTARRGSKHDSGSRRLVAALLLAIALISAQEMTLASALLRDQSISAYARQMPEVAVALLAGAAMPIAFIVMIVDQHMQRRIRAAVRRSGRRSRLGTADTAAAVTTQSAGLPPPTT
jgi:NO-binding membrane sensor protein with MHYT domain